MHDSQCPLILGTATGYKPEQVSAFVDSLKQTGFKGAVRLLVERENLALQGYLASNGIGIILLDSTPWWAPSWFAARRFNGGRMRLVQKAAARFACLVPPPLLSLYGVHLGDGCNHIVNWRFFHYLHFLQANRRLFSQVLLTDVRDVVFQTDPFEGVPARCLWFFQEYSALTLGSEPSNRFWVETAYGSEGLQRIQQNGILCAATMMGGTGSMIEYLRRLTAELIRLTTIAGGGFGSDQAAHNWLYWSGLFPEAEVKENFLGPVATLALEPLERLKFDGRGRLLNHDGRPAPMLHQYDRHPEVVQRITAHPVAD